MCPFVSSYLCSLLSNLEGFHFKEYPSDASIFLQCLIQLWEFDQITSGTIIGSRSASISAIHLMSLES